jgi:hypothetical protein
MTKKTDVLLGFAVGTGAPVMLPIRHTVVTGQTQEAGKTTALEAMIARSGVRAVCFVTKRGEGSFAGARRIDPYFHEQADWQFVASILEASRGEKLKFERAWIIRASKGARTLADVQRNVRKSLETAKGMSADVYQTLEAYLEVVVPQIAEVNWATSVHLGTGINAMDLTDLATEMQHLVIRSTIDWVLHKEENTVVVVPEAWKFIPQGRGTPVKLAAEAYIRQAAGLGNYLWLDSQDIAGVDKTILKSVPVWVLGVQRESNEVARTLAQIPGGIKKPKPDQIATLGLGEFFACWGSTIVRTFVQPAWMTEADAKAIALGQMTVADARRVPHKEPQPKEPKMGDATKLSEDRIIEGLARRLGGMAGLAAANSAPERPAPPASSDEDAMYQRFKSRLAREAPAILQVLAIENEIEIRVERKTVEINQDSARGMVVTLIHEGFFDSTQPAVAAWNQLKRRWDYRGISARVNEQCDALTSMGFLTKEGNGYQAVASAKKRIKTTA